jgi:hypothetical protein
MAGLDLNVNDITLAGRRMIASLFRSGIRAAPTITNEGAAGATDYGYRIEAVTEEGEVPLSPEGTTSTGNATLDGTNYNHVEWVPFGISHMAIGRGTSVVPPFGINNRVGNNYQMEPAFSGGIIASVILHNDFPAFNFTVNGVPNVFYFIDVNNNQQDKAMSFTSDPPLVVDKYNHLFLTHAGTAGAFGLGQIEVVDTDTPATPVKGDAIIYLGYVLTTTEIRSVVTACRMFDKLGGPGTILPDEVEYLDDRFLVGSISIPSLETTAARTKNLLATARFGPGIADTIREVGVFANDGRDLVAYKGFLNLPITAGQRLRLRWRMAF